MQTAVETLIESTTVTETTTVVRRREIPLATDFVIPRVVASTCIRMVAYCAREGSLDITLDTPDGRWTTYRYYSVPFRVANEFRRAIESDSVSAGSFYNAFIRGAFVCNRLVG